MIAVDRELARRSGGAAAGGEWAGWRTWVARRGAGSSLQIYCFFLEYALSLVGNPAADVGCGRLVRERRACLRRASSVSAAGSGHACCGRRASSRWTGGGLRVVWAWRQEKTKAFVCGNEGVRNGKRRPSFFPRVRWGGGGGEKKSPPRGPGGDARWRWSDVGGGEGVRPPC